MDPTAYVEQHRERFLAQLQDLLRIPSVSALSQHRPDVWRAAEWVAEDLRAIGLHGVEVIPDAEGGHPLVYGEWLDAPGCPTLLIYGHYDVQPPDPLELWQTPPFEPAVRGDDLYARGASDDKGQMLALLKGVEAVLQTQGRLPINLKVLIEGEEEVSGTHIERFVRAHAERLRADAALIADSPMFAPGVPTLCTGLRGLVYTEIEAHGAAHDLHSGLYGGAAPNALGGLAAILVGLKDESTGRIQVPGFYDALAPPTEQEKAAWARLPFDERAYLTHEVGASALAGEQGYSVLERTWARPTLDVNGAVGGFTGEGAKTVIPARAMAKVSMRLVPRQDPVQVFASFERYVQELCPPGVRATARLLGRAAPVTLPADTPAMRAAATALEETFGTPAALVRMGGSIPIVATFLSAAGVPSVLAGFGLPDDNLHAPNEKFHLPNFFAAIRFTARFVQRSGGA
jgi:acetylornithine deacetylase/succinyl-diaminopimelate desuccinylase-like protein